MALTDIAVKSANSKDKPYRLTDGDGMYLLVTATVENEPEDELIERILAIVKKNPHPNGF
jgi:hypothetical protein